MAKAKLGSVVSSVRGSLGGLVVLDGRNGTVVKAKPTYRRPTSPAQRLVEERMKIASAAWSSLNAAQVAVWRVWGEARGRTAQTAFIGLATKFLQANPGLPVPLAPPTTEFIADDVAILATPSFHSGERKGTGDRESGPEAPLSPPNPPGRRLKRKKDFTVYRRHLRRTLLSRKRKRGSPEWSLPPPGRTGSVR